MGKQECFIQGHDRKHLAKTIVVSMQTNNSFNRQEFLPIKRGAVLTALGLTMFFSPADAAINPVKGGAETKTNGNVTEVYAGTVYNKKGLSVFKEYTLDANKIANMHFNKLGGADTAEDLINIVQSKIDINGTVNAVKNNQIGGNLYFLSKDGIVVGKTGVINAGSLTLMTPNAKAIDALSGNSIEEGKLQNYLISNYNKIVNHEVALNRTGSITIDGHINTTNGIAAIAPFIKLGTGATAAENGNAALESGIVDFSQLVNIKDAQGKIVTNSGLENLTAVTPAEKSGNIELKAFASTVNYNDENDSNILSNNYLGNNATKAEVITGAGSIIKAAGDVSITATAVNKPYDTQNGWLGFDPEEWNLATLLDGAIDKTIAHISIDGNVTGQNDIITAKADANFNSNKTQNPLQTAKTGYSFLKKIFPKALTTDTTELEEWFDSVKIGLAVVHNDATVDIGQNATIKALAATDFTRDKTDKTIIEKDSDGINKGGALSINAISNVSAKMFVSTKNTAKTDDQGSISTYVNAGVVWTNAESAATVNILGKVESKGATNVSAVSTNEATASAKVKAPGKADPEKGEHSASSYVNAAISALTQTNNATVNIEHDINSAGDLNVESNASHTVKVDAQTETDSNALVGTVLAYVDTNSQANITVNGNLTGKSVTVKANNYMSSSDIEANNAQGDISTWADAGEEYVTKMVSDGLKTLDNFFNNSKKAAPKDDEGAIEMVDLSDDKEKENNKGGVEIAADNKEKDGEGQEQKANKSIKTDWNKYFTVGAAVVVGTEEDKAKITIQPGKDIVAVAGDVNVKADSTIYDYYTQVASCIAGGKDKDELKNMTSAAVGYVNQKSDASVVIKGSSKEDAVHLTGANVNVNASSNYEYHRQQVMFEKLMIIYNLVKEVGGDVSDDFKKLDSSIKSLYNYYMAPEKLMDTTKEWYTLDETLASLMKTYRDVDALQKKAQGLKDEIKHMLSVGSHAQFYVGSSTQQEKDSKSDATTVVTGTIGILNVNNNANVVIGKNAIITADKDVDLTAKASQIDVSLVGKVEQGGLTPTSGGKSGLGGTVFLNYTNVYSTVAVAEGVSISGQNVNAEADNSVNHVAFVNGGSKTGALGLTGMVSYMLGDSNSIVAIDDEAKLTAIKGADETGKLNILANNNANLINIMLNYGTSTGSALGAAVGVLDYGANTIASVADNDVTADGINKTKREEVNDYTALIQEGLGSDAYISDDFGLTTDEQEKGTIDSDSITVKGDTSGTMNNAVVAGASTDSSENPNGENAAANNGKGVKDAADKLAKSGIKLTGAGSAAVNLRSGTTAGLIENVTVNSKTVDNEAVDSSYLGSYSGAGALSKFGQGKSSSGFSGTLSGAVAVNEVTKNTSAQIKNSTINGTDGSVILNKAENAGTSVAAGLALGVETGKRESSSGFDIAVSGSFDYVTSNVHANMINDTVNKTDVQNIANDKDIQIAGGVTGTYAKSSVGAGAAIAVNSVTNDIAAKVQNGTYENIGNFLNYAVSSLREIGGAISLGIVNDNQNYVTLNGAVVYNNLNNTLTSSVDGTTITTNTFQVQAYDGKLPDDAKDNEYIEALAKDGFMTDAAAALADANGKTGKGDIDADKQNIKDGKDNREAYSNSVLAPTYGGNIIVGSAISVDVNTSDKALVTAGLAGNYGNVTNTFDAKVENSTITAGADSDGVIVKALSDTAMVNVGAGVAVTTGKKGIEGAGSVVLQNIENNITAQMLDSTIRAKDVNIKGKNDDTLVSVAGQVGVTHSNAALGLTWARNNLTGTTKAQILGSNFAGLNNQGINLTVDAAKDENTWAIAAGVDASLNSGAGQGAVAINNQTSNTKAIIDKSEKNTKTKIDDAGDVKVTTNDTGSLKAVAGSVTVSLGKVAVGGALATNTVGSSDQKQENLAQINNTNINSKSYKKNLTVTSTDKSHLTTLAIGGTVSTDSMGVSAEGSIATSGLHKKIEASMTDSNVDADATGEKIVNVSADNLSDIVSSADAIAFTLGNVGAGVGFSVNVSDMDTDAYIKKGTYNLYSSTVKAESNNDIFDIGIGAAATLGTGGSLAGSVFVDNINNNTTAYMENVTMLATGTTAVLADSTEQMQNYGGALSVTAGKGFAALGATVGVNKITGNTTAKVLNSDITAKGEDGGVSLTDYASSGKGEISSSSNSHKGLVVNAKANHEIDNIILTAGVVVSDSVGIGVGGTVGVNNIEGSTSAFLRNSDVNKNMAIYTKGADVYVSAKDISDISSHEGIAAVGIGGEGAGMAGGAAADNSKMNRTVEAETSNDKTGEHIINADNFSTKAFGRNEVLVSASGIAVGAGEGFGAGVCSNIGIANITSKSTALVKNVQGTNAGFDISAEQVDKVHQYSNGLSVGGGTLAIAGGLGVNYVYENNTVLADLQSSNFSHWTDETAIDKVIALGDMNLVGETADVAIGAGVGGAGIIISNVDNIRNTVGVSVTDSTVGDASKKAGSFTAKAENKVKTSFTNVPVAVGLAGISCAFGTNTVDSSIKNTIDNSNIMAKTINVNAIEDLNIDQTLAGANVGIGIGISVNKLSSAINASVEPKFTDEEISEASTALMSKIDGLVNSTYEQQNAMNKKAAGVSGLEKGGITEEEMSTGFFSYDKGGNVKEAGVHIKINDSQLKAAKDATVDAQFTVNDRLELGQGNVATIDYCTSMGLIDSKPLNDININNSTISSKNTNISTTQDGVLNNETVQCGLGVLNKGNTISYAENQGKNTVTIKNATLKGDDVMAVSANNSVAAEAYTTGVQVSGLYVGSMKALGYVNNINQINVRDKSNFMGSDMGFKINDTGTAWAKAGSYPYNLLGGADSTALAEMKSSDIITIDDGNVFDGDKLTISSTASQRPDETSTPENTKFMDNAKAVIHGVLVSGADFNIKNEGRATTDIQNTVNIGDETYQKTQKDDSNTTNPGEVNVVIKAGSSTSSYVEVIPVNVGLIFAHGANEGYLSDKNTATINIFTGDGDKAFGSLYAQANISDKTGGIVNGDGGGVIAISPSAAQLTNTVNTDSKVNVNGTIVSQGNIFLEAVNSITSKPKAEAIQATVSGGSGVELKNNITTNSHVNVIDATLIAEGALTANALNIITLGETNGQMLKGNGYGIALGINYETLTNNITSNATVNIDKSQLTSSEGMVLGATTNEQLYLNSYLFSTGKLLGIMETSDLHENNTIVNTDKIQINNGSSLHTDDKDADIILAAADDMSMFTNAMAETSGSLGGVAISKVENTITRNNSVDVASGTIYSLRDVELYAGKKTDGELSNLTLYGMADAYNRTLLPFNTNPVMTNTLKQNNIVSVGSTSEISSIRNMNIYADKGREVSKTGTGKYTTYGSDTNADYVSTTQKKNIPGETATNYVNIDGKVTAGIANNQSITIGSNGQTVLFRAEDRKAVSEDTVDWDGLTVVVDAEGTTLTKDSLQHQTIDYASALYSRCLELDKLVQEYSADKNGSAYLGYVAERERIFNLMQELGFFDSQGNLIHAYVDTVTIPDLVSGGGDVTVQTSNFYGNGSVEAKGTPNVEIINNTNLYMNINNITLGDAGGSIIYNTTTLDTNNQGTNPLSDQIKTLNADQNKTVSTVNAAKGKAGQVIITGNYSGTLHYTNPDTKETGTITPLADIEVNGKIDANNGLVHITSAHNNIQIQGKTAKDSAGINGADIILTADNGSVSQGFIEGIVNVGGSVQDQYESIYDSVKEQLDKDYAGKTASDVTKSSADKAAEAGGNMIAGNNIYISASNININGKMQSGFSQYIVDVPNDDETNKNLASIKNAWESGGSKALSDSAVTSNSSYLLIKGSDVWDETQKCYVKNVDVYYNPSTDSLVIPDIDAKGGNIRLTGYVSSTGGGRITCLDGAYDITVNNKQDTTLQLGKLVSNDVEGKIIIKDTALNTSTEITRKNTVVKELHNEKNVISSADNIADTDIIYQPLENIRYNWTTGQETTTTITYTKESKESWWGLGKKTEDATAKIDEYTEKAKEDGSAAKSDPVTSDNKPMSNGEYVGILDKAGTSAFSVIYNKVESSNPIKSDVYERHYSTGLFGFNKRIEYIWTEKQGSTQTYLASVKADNPIAINFIGHGDGTSTIDVNSAGNINITNNVGNTNYLGTVNITSQKGSLKQSGGAISGKNVNLQAAGNMDGMNLTAGDSMNLSAVNTATDGVVGKNIDITVKTGYDKTGNVNLGNMGSDVVSTLKVTTTGSMSQQAGTLLTSKRIDLQSTTGNINAIVQTGQMPIKTDTLSASLNAQAKGNISLTEATGNMRIGTVKAGGDVVLNTTGSISDALPYVSVSGEDEDDLLAKWKSIGLIAGGDETLSTAKENAYKKSTGKEMTYTYIDADKLLYSIQDSFINPTSEDIKTDDKTPNIVGTNITLNVGNGAGQNSDTKAVIKLADLGNNIDDLKILSRADASTVTWNSNKVDGQETGTVTVTKKLPLGIQTLTSTGKITVKSTNTADGKGNVYIQGRIDSSNTDAQNKDLSIDTITTEKGNVLITSLGSVLNGYNDSEHTDAQLKAVDLNIRSMGNIGAVINPITTDISGVLNGVATDNVYIRQLGNNNLAVQSVSAGGDITLQAVNDVVSYTDPSTVAQGYIRSEKTGNITVISDEGSIGTAQQSLRVRNTDVTGEETDDENTVSLQAAKGDVYVEGVTTDTNGITAAGTLRVKEITAKSNIGIKVNGYLDLLGNTDLTAENSISINTAKTLKLDGESLTAPTVKLESGEDLLLQDSLVKGTDVILTADSGKVVQSYTKEAAKSAVEASKLAVSSGSGVDLQSEYNKLSAVEMSSIGAGDVLLGNGGDTDLNVSTVETIAGNIDIHNYKKGLVNALNVQGDLAATGSITLTNEEAAVNVEKVHPKDALTGERITVKAQTDFHNAGNITATKDVDITGENNVTTVGVITAGTDVKLMAKTGEVSNKGSITATTGGVELNAYTDVNNSDTSVTEQSEITAAQNVILHAQTGSIDNQGSLLSQKAEVNLESKEENINNGTIIAANDVNITSTDSHVINNASILTRKGKVTLDGQEMVINAGTGVVMAMEQGDIVLESAGDVYNNNRLVTSDGDVVLKSLEGDLYNQNEIESSKSIKLLAGEGTVYNDHDLTAQDDIVVMSKTDITIDNKLTAGNDISLTSTSGSIVNKNYVTSGRDTNITALQGNVTNAAIINAEGSVRFNAAQDVNSKQNLTAGQNIEFVAQNGNINVEDYLETVNGSIKLETNNASAQAAGNINVQGSLIAKGQAQNAGISILTEKGNINLEQAIIAQGQGLVRITADEGNITSLGNITSGQGSVDVGAQQGNLSLKNVKAGTLAGVGVGTGNLNMENIAGSTVILYAKNAQDTIHTGDIIVGETLSVSGNNLALGNITKDAQQSGTMNLNIVGAGANQPVDSFTAVIDNQGNDVVFDTLWVKNADVTVKNGNLAINNLSVEDVAHFHNNGLDTAVYGGVPVRGNEDSIFLVDSRRTRGQNNINYDRLFFGKDNKQPVVDEVLQQLPLGSNSVAAGGADGWMNLYFNSENRQTSNGILLHVKNYRYVYDQRYSGEDLLRYIQENHRTGALLSDYQPPERIYFERFNLYDNSTLPESSNGIILD